MADPLTQTVDTFAPAPLGIFDSNAAESITSRYANTRRGLGVLDTAVKAAGSAQGLIADRDRMAREAERYERDRLLQSREDRDYEEKQAAREERAGFISDLLKKDPNDPDFNAFTIDLLRNAPAAVAEDPVIKDILDVRRREADQGALERRRKEEIDMRFNNELEKMKIRTQSMAGLKGVDPEMIKKYTLPDGTIDPALYYEAGKRERELEMGEFKEKTEIRKEAAKELFSERKMDDRQRELFRETKDILVNDTDAFPNRTDLVLAQARAAGVEDYYLANPKEMLAHPNFGESFREAQAWDKKKFENEVLAAKEAATPEDYIAKGVGKLTPTAQEARRRVWEYAHQNDEPAAEKPAAPAAAEGEWETYKKDGKWYRRKKVADK